MEQANVGVPVPEGSAVVASPSAGNVEKMSDRARRWWDMTPKTVKIGVLVVLVLLVVVLIAWFADRSRRETLKTSMPMAHRLIKEASRWGMTSEQDESPYLALIHANYAVAYARAAREAAPETDIAKKLHVDLSELVSQLSDVQEKAVRRLSRVCPDAVPDMGPISVATGWMG